VRKYVIDTNALISFVTDRNPKQQQRMKELFESASLLKGLILCHSHVLTEFIYVMDRVYRVSKDRIKEMAFLPFGRASWLILEMPSSRRLAKPTKVPSS
jgi:predicted nucleic acid-binding protein